MPNLTHHVINGNGLMVTTVTIFDLSEQLEVKWQPTEPQDLASSIERGWFWSDSVLFTAHSKVQNDKEDCEIV